MQLKKNMYIKKNTDDVTSDEGGPLKGIELLQVGGQEWQEEEANGGASHREAVGHPELLVEILSRQLVAAVDVYASTNTCSVEGNTCTEFLR